MTHNERYNPKPKHKDIVDLAHFLEGNSENFEIRESPEYMTALANAVGIDLSDTPDTNGWQLDYWIKGTYAGRDLCVSGSAWYGYAAISWE